METRHLAGDPAGLVALVLRVVPRDGKPCAAVAPEVLRLTARVVGDDRVRGVKDVLGGAVVLIEHDDRGVREGLLELEDVADVCAAKAIDGLVAVADHGDVVVLLAEEQHDLVLGAVGVLVLVDKDVLEATLVVLEHLGLLL